jgi:transposase
VTRRSSNYPPELRERAVRMVAEVRPHYDSQWAAIVAVAAKPGIGTAGALGYRLDLSGAVRARLPNCSVHLLRRDQAIAIAPCPAR